MTREEIVKRAYKKYPQDIIEIVNDDNSITREDCNHNLRNAYMQGLIDNNISYSTDVDKAADEYTDNPANYLEYSDDGWEDKTDIDYVERAFKAGAEWRQNNLWKSSDGEDLPEIDREVVILYQRYPLENCEYSVGFGHRPKEYWDGKNVDTGEITRYYPKRYDKGGWNGPNIKWWLDLNLPKTEE